MKLIILDRDGVVNFDSDEYIKSVEEFRFIPGVPEAIASLKRAGYMVALASNQAGIARGLFSEKSLREMTEHMVHVIRDAGGDLDLIRYCTCGPHEDCPCRKPLPGMLLDISTTLGTSLDGVPFVGDSYRDIQAARSAGALPVLVRTGKGERTIEKYSSDLSDVPIFVNFPQYVAQLLSHQSIMS